MKFNVWMTASRNLSLTLSVALTAALWTVGASAAAPDRATVHMEAYGDSLTAGFLSGTNVTRQQDLKLVSKVVSDLAMFLITGNRDYLKGHHRPDLAWPAIYAANLRKQGETVELQNLAVSGSRTWQLPDQVRAAKVNETPATAFFFMGHNDLCHNHTTPEELAQKFVQEYTAGVREWDARHSGSTAYFVPVSRIDLVYETLKDYTWYEGEHGRYSCKDSWEKLFPYCPAYYRMAKKGQLEGYIVPKIRAMNRALEQAVKDWERESRNNNQYRFADVPETLPIGPDFFAVDCYHLSDVGQKIMSEQIFEETY